MNSVKQLVLNSNTNDLVYEAADRPSTAESAKAKACMASKTVTLTIGNQQQCVADRVAALCEITFCIALYCRKVAALYLRRGKVHAEIRKCVV